MRLTETGRGLLRPDVGKRDWIDFVKGGAMILIVAYHVTLFLNTIGFDSAGIGRIKLVLELFPMPAFFLIAGIFHARVREWSFPDLWRRRLRLYLYLYVLWSAIRFVFYLVVPNVRSEGAGTEATNPLALLGILVWPISSYWFIYALFVFTLVLWCFRALPSWVLLAASAALSVLSSSGILDADNVGIDRMTEYLLFFALGAYLNRRAYALVDALRPWHAVALIAAFLAFGALGTVLPVLGSIPGLALLGQLLAVGSGIALASYLVHVRALSWISYIGARALNIYLVHVFVIALIAIPLSALPQLDSLPGRGLVLSTILTATVIVVSILLTRYLTRVSWLFVYPFRRRSTTAGAPRRTAPAGRTS